jgi:diguanylate cyclase
MLWWEQFGVGDDKYLAEKHIDIDELRHLTALDSVAIMDSLPEERFERLARIRRNQFKVSTTLITFIDAERQWFKTHFGISETEGPQAS